jgi:hypothetical protein
MTAVDQSPVIHPLREEKKSTGPANLLLKHTVTPKNELEKRIENCNRMDTPSIVAAIPAALKASLSCQFTKTNTSGFFLVRIILPKDSGSDWWD